MNIEQLLDNVKMSIEDENIKLSNVGNRPHYPVFVAFNGASSNNCSSFFNVIRGIWSAQICKKLLAYRYQKGADGIVFSGLTDDNVIDINDVYKDVSDVAKTRDVFENMNCWCFYNVIDTGSLDSIEDFEDAYDSLSEFHDVIDRNIKSMLCIVLRQNRDPKQKELNYKIREFLVNRTDYDGTVILSNLARGGREFDVQELYSMVANIVLLTNNDAYGKFDDDDYKERNVKLYSKTPVLVSYNCLQKPIYKILYCMVTSLMGCINERLDSSALIGTKELQNIIGINKDSITIFDAFLRYVAGEVVKENACTKIVPLVPMKDKYIIKDEELAQMSFMDFANNIYKDSFKTVIKSYARKFFDCDECQTLMEQFSDNVFNEITLDNARNITAESLNVLFESIEDKNNLSEGCTLFEYFKKAVVQSLKQDYIYPRCKELLLEVFDENNIKIAIDNLRNLEAQINDSMPVSGFDDISLEYGNSMLNFLKTDEGIPCLRSILKVSNTEEDLYKALEDTLYKADKYSRAQINKSFIEMWAAAMKLKGQDVFSKIRSELAGDGYNDIMLKGTYPVKDLLTVYKLHTTNRDGENPTPLFSQFNEAFKQVVAVQFFNTGNDDAIESIQFFECKGNDLLLGANS